MLVVCTGKRLPGQRNVELVRILALCVLDYYRTFVVQPYFNAYTQAKTANSISILYLDDRRLGVLTSTAKSWDMMAPNTDNLSQMKLRK